MKDLTDPARASLRRLMKKRGLSGYRLGLNAGVDPSTIHLFLNGTRAGFQTEQWIRLAIALEAPLDELLGRAEVEKLLGGRKVGFVLHPDRGGKIGGKERP